MVARHARGHHGPNTVSLHYLVVAKLKMKMKQRQCAKKKLQAFDVAKLKQSEVEEAFSIEVHNKFAVLESVVVVDIEGTILQNLIRIRFETAES